MVAQGIGFYAQNVTEVEKLEAAVKECLSHNGPALLNVYTRVNELIVPPSISLDNVTSMALYSTKAILEGNSHDVIDLTKKKPNQ